MAAVYEPPRESTIYADISVDAAVLEAVLAETRAKGQRATVTALVALAAAHAMRCVPEANVVWRRGAFHRRSDVTTWIYATSGDGSVLGVPVRHDWGGQRAALPAVQERVDRASRHRAAKADADRRGWYRRLAGLQRPWFLRRFIRGFSRWVHDVERPAQGIDARGYGSVGITNLGSLGIPTAAAIPLPPHARHVVLLSLGTIHGHPWVQEGQVIAGRRLPITAALDHRAFVGTIAARLLAAFQAGLTDRALLDRLVRGE